MSATSPGEKRRRSASRARKAVAYAALIAPLKAAGASCATCKHFGHVPMSKQRCCDLETDFQGYSIREAQQLCPHFQPQP